MYVTVSYRNEYADRLEVVLENGVAFHAYLDDRRCGESEEFVLAMVRQVEDPTNDYDSLEDVPDEILDAMDYVPELYSLRIGTTPVIVDYNGTLFIPRSYENRLSDLKGEYRFTLAWMC